MLELDSRGKRGVGETGLHDRRLCMRLLRGVSAEEAQKPKARDGNLIRPLQREGTEW